MKKILGLLVIMCLFLFTGCKQKDIDKEMNAKRYVVVNGVTLYVYEIEGHEYMGYLKTNGEFSTKPSFNCFLVHSETCKNPIHFPKKGTVLVHKNGSTYVLPDTLVEKVGYEIENGAIKVE
jgi:hypothetical protein